MAVKKIQLNQIIQDDIVSAVVNKDLRPGDRLPTEFELMDKYNVSRITVVSALRELVDRGYVVRYPRRGSFISDDVENAMADIYVADADAGNGVSAKTLPDIKRAVGFIIPNIRDFFAINLIQGVLNRFAEIDDFNVVISSSHRPNSEEQIIKDMHKRRMDGIVLFPVDQEVYNERILEMKLNKYPLVLIDRYLPGIETHYVISDNVIGGRLAAEHLLKLGHTKILVCCGAPLDTFSVKERVTGVREAAMAAENAVIDDDDILGDFFEKMKRPAAKEAMEKKLLEPEYTGIITTDSAVAAFLLDFFERRGVNVPKDKSIVSYDAPAAPRGEQSLFTHIDQMEYLMGYEAGSIMRELLLDGKKNERDYVKKVIAPKLIGGRTSAVIGGEP